MNPVETLAEGVRRLARRLLSDVCARGRRTPDDACTEDCESRPLTRMDPGTRGSVSCLEEPDHRESRKLASMGILPGVPVQVLQDRPVYVVRVRHTEYALDDELASRVRVVPAQAPSSPSQ